MASLALCIFSILQKINFASSPYCSTFSNPPPIILLLAALIYGLASYIYKFFPKDFISFINWISSLLFEPNIPALN